MIQTPCCADFKFAAVILAAGLSSRMGRFKPLLPVDGLPALQRIVLMFQIAGVTDILVVTGHRAEELDPVIERTGARSVFNARFEEGMFSSIQAGVADIQVESRAFFVMPVDIPLVRPSTVLSLIETFRRNPGHILFPTFQGRRGHPPLIDVQFRPNILSYEGEGGLRSALGMLIAMCMEVDVPDRFILADMDTPKDYEQLQAGPAGWFRPKSES